MIEYENNWANYRLLKRRYIDNRTKSQRIKGDLEMILCKSNMSPINTWGFLWKQLYLKIFFVKNNFELL